MPRLRYLSDRALSWLKANASALAPRYREDSPWADGYLAEAIAGSWSMETDVDVGRLPSLASHGGSAAEDLQNARSLYVALQGLTPAQAADERLWAYMTHVLFWGYMRSRWPVDAAAEHRIRERYFVDPPGPRGLVRNGISRLWWYAHVTYDERRDDPFELTAVLLHTEDVAQQLMERSISNSPRILKAVLSALKDACSAGKHTYERHMVRAAAQHLIRQGGVTVLDALDEPDLAEMVNEAIDLAVARSPLSRSTAPRGLG
jgi:hypothetical protein